MITKFFKNNKMKQLISLHKKQSLCAQKSDHQNEMLAMQVNHELMNSGYILSKQAFDVLASNNASFIEHYHNVVVNFLNKVIGDDGYQAIYTNFPQAVMGQSMEVLTRRARYYYRYGSFEPEGQKVLTKTAALEPVNYTEIGVIDDKQFEAIFTSMLYQNSSISKSDKSYIDWFIDYGYSFSFEAIKFNEIKAYVGAKLLDSSLKKLPTRSATTVLRLYSAYSGGDEGLKENTKFKNPTAPQRKMLMATLNDCYDLEESFKVYREKWLRLLFLLHPMSAKNKVRYPVLFSYAEKLRNTPKELKTFAAKVEAFLDNKDYAVFELLKKRSGYFARMLNRLIDIYGYVAVDEFLESKPSNQKLIELYNYFETRKSEQKRAVVLASQSRSGAVAFDGLKAMDENAVNVIKDAILRSITPVSDKKVYVHPELYWRGIPKNNRASALSLNSANGKITDLSKFTDKTIRAYVHWHGNADIDLSAFLISSKDEVTKVGWDGQYIFEDSVVYSGDNTGTHAKNAEYIDLNIEKLRTHNVEWAIFEARIYARQPSYAKWSGENPRMGFMMRKHPMKNSNWLPKTVSEAMVLQCDSKVSYTFAVHLPTLKLVDLDVSTMSGNNVGTTDEALEIKALLVPMVMGGNSREDKTYLRQGHIAELLFGGFVDNEDEADIVFNENTNWEDISVYL